MKSGRLASAALVASLIGFLAVALLTLAVSSGWLDRSDLAPWFSWPALLVPGSIEEQATAGICATSLDRPCAPMPETYAGLDCWAGQGQVWCADQPFATATAVWLLAFVAVYFAGLILRAIQPSAALPQEQQVRRDRNESWFALILKFGAALWMFWTAYHTIYFRGITDNSVPRCIVLGEPCNLDVSDKLPFAVTLCIAGLFSLMLVVFTARRLRDDSYYGGRLGEDEEN